MLRTLMAVALVMAATGLAVAGDYMLPPLDPPKWWHTPDQEIDDTSRCMYVSFQTNPNDLLPPDYVYNGFISAVPDDWTATNGLDVGHVFDDPVVDPTWGDGVGLNLKADEELSLMLGSRALPDDMPERERYGSWYFVEVVYRAADRELDSPLTLNVQSEDYTEITPMEEVLTPPDENGWVIQYWKGLIFPHPEWNQFTLTAGEDVEIDSMWAGTSPEPSAIALLIAGAAGLARRRRR
jgi:hypothetical protein